jgi:predicted extracellular nuclease
MQPPPVPTLPRSSALRRDLCLLLALATTGCGLTPKPATDDGTSGDDTGTVPDVGVTAFDVNDGTVSIGETVTISGLVVTSPFRRAADGFFVEDPAGGAGSGLFVYNTDIATFEVAPGDEVTVTGTVADYYGWTQLAVADASAVTVTGTATIPDPVDLGDGSGVDWNSYESVVVKLDDQSITAVNEFNTGTLSGGINLDDGFEYLDFECGGHYDSVAGVVFYAYAEYSLNPRTDDDMVGYAPSTTVVPSTVAEARAGGVCGQVQLTDVVATSPSSGTDETTFYVQDPSGGDSNGIAVFVHGGTMDVNVGDVLTVTGSVTDYNDLTELVIEPGMGEVTGSGATPVATPLSTAPDDWEPYESMLLTLSDVQITADPDGHGQAMTNYGIYVDDQFVDLGLASGDTFSSLTGVLTFTFGEWKIEPRVSADAVD